MIKTLEAACGFVLSDGRLDSILNCLIIVLAILICVFCLFLALKNRKNSEKEKAHRFSHTEKTTGLLRPSNEGSVRVAHISAKKPRG